MSSRSIKGHVGCPPQRVWGITRMRKLLCPKTWGTKLGDRRPVPQVWRPLAVALPYSNARTTASLGPYAIRGFARLRAASITNAPVVRSPDLHGMNRRTSEAAPIASHPPCRSRPAIPPRRHPAPPHAVPRPARWQSRLVPQPADTMRNAFAALAPVRLCAIVCREENTIDAGVGISLQGNYLTQQQINFSPRVDAGKFPSYP